MKRLLAASKSVSLSTLRVFVLEAASRCALIYRQKRGGGILKTRRDILRAVGGDQEQSKRQSKFLDFM